MTGENGTPATPDWTPTPHACPFETCFVCSQHDSEGFGVYPLPERFVLGEN